MLSFPEQSSIFCATPDKLLEAFKRLETLLPKLIPSVFSKAHKIKGDGGAGTIVEYFYAPEGRTLKMTTEVFDEVNHVFHSDLQLEGDSQFSSFKLHLQLFPGLLEDTTRSQWTFIYEPDTAPPPLDIIAIAHPSIVAFSAYLHSGHEFQSSSNASAELEESLTETIPSAGIEPAESSPETITNCASTEAAGSLTETIPSASTEPAESLTDTIPSASTELAESLTETIPSASTEAAGNLPKAI